MKTRAKQKGQAIIEMALFGTFILLIGGTVLSYMQQLNEDQYVAMEAFRKALAGSSSAAMSYQITSNWRQIDLVSGAWKGPRATSSSSASVSAAVPVINEDFTTTDIPSVVKYQIGEDVFDLNEDDEVEESKTVSSQRIEDNLVKEENESGIKTTRAVIVKDKLVTTLLDADGGVIKTVTQYLGPNRRYSSGEKQFSRQTVRNTCNGE